MVFDHPDVCLPEKDGGKNRHLRRENPRVEISFYSQW
jgi:hypothetical protein